MSGARDWTIDIETKGLPELKEVYKLYGAEKKEAAKSWPQFGHNYNQVSREYMYNWFNKHLELGQTEPVAEKPFVPVPPKELSVFNEQYPRPKDAVDAERLRKFMTEASDKQNAALQPKDAESLKEFRRVIGTALRVMVNDRLPKAVEVETKDGAKEERDGYSLARFTLTRKGQGEQVPVVALRGKEVNGPVVIWVHPEGSSSLMKDGKLVPVAKEILDRKAGIVAPDVFMTGAAKGAKPTTVNAQYAGYTFGYNRSILANRVHDILTVIASIAEGAPRGVKFHLVGIDQAGPWVLLARALCGDAVARTAVDLDQFRFEKVRTASDEMMLPGALKYGGLPAFAALCAPGELLVHNRGGDSGAVLKAAYKAAGKPESLREEADKATLAKVIEWLLR
jgi:hypothetical protein